MQTPYTSHQHTHSGGSTSILMYTSHDSILCNKLFNKRHYKLLVLEKHSCSVFLDILHFRFMKSSSPGARVRDKMAARRTRLTCPCQRHQEPLASQVALSGSQPRERPRQGRPILTHIDVLKVAGDWRDRKRRWMALVGRGRPTRETHNAFVCSSVKYRFVCLILTGC